MNRDGVVSSMVATPLRVGPVVVAIVLVAVGLYWITRPRSFAMDLSDLFWRRRYLKRSAQRRMAPRSPSRHRPATRSDDNGDNVDGHLDEGHGYRVIVPRGPAASTGRATTPLPGVGQRESGLLPYLHATVITIDFSGTEMQLNGSSHDGDRIKSFFEHICQLDVHDRDRFVFLNDRSDVLPTDSVIRGAMDRLTQTPGPEDTAVLWWHYSGHGLLVHLPPERLAQRPPGNLTDESIVPINIYEGGELITDGEMFRRLVLPLVTRPHVRAFMLFDSCYAGMNLRLKHIYEVDADDNVVHRINNDFPADREYLDHVMSKVNIVALCACRTTEEAAEVYSEVPFYQRPRPTGSEGTQVPYGALTDAAYDRFEADSEVDESQKCIRLPTTTWRQLIVSIQKQFREEGIEEQHIELPDNRGVRTMTQHVQLTSSKPLHLDSEVFAIFDPDRPFP